ncbi:hypothetical protein GIB67_024471 [Kingdonia uniflora]|uniref:Serpin domain-containing protein n=1 Tax=Kingdonia uniflora TaxID=39325 RepID=A0A7J7L135_9MAGN|nr:hypothetical protein GIB67_024471 [Kingdonia uniflora]
MNVPRSGLSSLMYIVGSTGVVKGSEDLGSARSIDCYGLMSFMVRSISGSSHERVFRFFIDDEKIGLEGDWTGGNRVDNSTNDDFDGPIKALELDIGWCDEVYILHDSNSLEEEDGGCTAGINEHGIEDEVFDLNHNDQDITMPRYVSSAPRYSPTSPAYYSLTVPDGCTPTYVPIKLDGYTPSSFFYSGSPPGQTQYSESLLTKVVPCLKFVESVGLKNAENSNFVFSPLSIQLALRLLATGSMGKTLEQMLSFLNADSLDDLNSVSSGLIESLNTKTEGDTLLSCVGGVWIDQSLTIKPSFKEVANTIYRAETEVADFQNKFEEVRAQVNTWTKEATNGLIESILPPGSVNVATRFVLANTLYFKGVWETEFKKTLTKDSTFYLHDGSSVKVPFMTTTINDPSCHCFEDFKGLRLPYKQCEDSSDLAMLAQIQNSGKKYAHELSKKSDCYDVGKFRIPKFKISFGFEASEALKEGGLGLPFCSDAELDGIAAGKVKVSKIHHRSFIEVNEQGTKAAAVTASGGIGMCPAPPSKVDFVADHPFIFMVRDDKSGMILFMGHVLNPLLE